MLSAARNHNQRGRGGRGRRGGRGYGQRNGGNGSTTAKKKDDKKLLKFHPLVKGKHPENSFDEVKKELVLSLEASDLEKADDIINCVRNMVLLDLDQLRPVLSFSQATTRAQEDRENEALKETYRYDMKKWDARVDALRNNKRKLHAKIIKFCTETMKFKLQQESDYEATLYDDPIALLQRIKKFMTTSDETDWEFFTLWESIRKFVNCVQSNTETPNEFRKRFEEKSKVVEALLGDNFLDSFIQTTQGYEIIPGSGVDGIESDAQLHYKTKAWEMFLANGMLYNSDRARYQSRIDAMNAAYMVVHQDYGQRMTYPTTVHNVTETLNRHKHDNRKSKNIKNMNNNTNNSGQNSHNCNSGNENSG